jgi:uncharacterized protein (TIGR02145 family)
MNVQEPFYFEVSGDYLTPTTKYTWSVKPSGVATIPYQGNKVASVIFNTKVTGAVVAVVAENDCGLSDTIFTQPITVGNECRDVKQPVATQLNLSAYVNHSFNLEVTIPAGGNTARTIQWYRVKDGAETLIAANSLLISRSEPVAGVYTYYCIAWPNCGTKEADGKKSGDITVTVKDSPQTLPVGTGGILKGKACFDIAVSNDGGACANLVDRLPHKTNFSTLAPVTYTFVATNPGKELRFEVIDPEGCVESVVGEGGSQGNTFPAGATFTIQVKYKTTLNSPASLPLIVGRSRTQAAKVTVYAAYNNGFEDVAISLTASIMDCACCGAYASPGVWKTFMCHNLGADESQNPFIPSQSILGNYYQWGQKNPVFDAATNLIGNWVSTGNIKDGSWTNTRGPEDPCPFGWRVPSNAEFTGIGAKNVNTRTYFPSTTWNNPYNKGVLLNKLLLLNGAGYRSSNSKWCWRNERIFYWTSTKEKTNPYHWEITPIYNGHVSDHEKSFAFTIRCIADE